MKKEKMSVRKYPGVATRTRPMDDSRGVIKDIAFKMHGIVQSWRCIDNEVHSGDSVHEFMRRSDDRPLVREPQCACHRRVEHGSRDEERTVVASTRTGVHFG